MSSTVPPAPSTREIAATAREALGLDDLRPGQAEAIRAVTSGRDTLAVMATGSGKSAIYQIAGALIDGPTLVISPLIALQRDQVASLEEEDAGRPERLDSTLRATERRKVLDGLAAGDVEFLFLAPEQLANEETFAAVAAAGPSLVVIDEAHCISAWGHDFRPAYRSLGSLIDRLGRPVVLALTATAAEPVRADVIEQLGLRDAAVIVRGFDRPNIDLSCRRALSAEERDDVVVDLASTTGGTGIVYVATRRRAEELAERIGARRPTASYHGAMRRSDRDEAQRRFDEGEIDVMVATNAFGMGIDRADVRFVLHADLPSSLDEYWQEIGRAGRDGAPASAVLVHRVEDVGRQRFFAGGGDDEAHARMVASRLEMLRSYTEQTTCRRSFVLGYFGEPFEPPCGACDNCRAGRTRPVDDRVAAPFADGDAVEHVTWGRGTVMRVAEGQVTVLFDDAGYRNLAVELVVEGALLRRTG